MEDAIFNFKTNSQLDYANKPEVERYQLRKIKDAIDYAQKRSPYYQRFFKGLKLSSDDIKSLEDIKKIPITTRQDLSEHNWDFIAISKDKWLDICSTSGTTHTPIFIPFTQHDVARVAANAARGFYIAGVDKNDNVQIALSLNSMWIGGFLSWLGCSCIGACSLRVGPGFIERQLENMLKFKVTVLCGEPSYLLQIGKLAKRSKQGPNLKVRLLLTLAGNVLNADLKRNRLGKELGEAWSGVPISSGYGCTEVGGSIGRECEIGQGYHLYPDMHYLEIVEPHTYKSLKFGERGLVVLTPFNVEGLPLLRYAPGDISFLIKDKCACGRTSLRLGPIIGRIDDAMKIKGVTIYPTQIEDVIASISSVKSYYIEAYTDECLIDRVRVFIVPVCDKKKEKQALIKKVKNIIKERVGITVEVFLRSNQEISIKTTLPASQKIRRFFDLREKSEWIKEESKDGRRKRK